MPDYEKLPARADGGFVARRQSIPRGAQAKFKYDPELKVFAFSRTLLLGLTYPYDWGFIPSTRGEGAIPST